MSAILSFLFLVGAHAFPELWAHGCQPHIRDNVMSTLVLDDATTNKCNLTLTQDGSTWLQNVNTSQPYIIQFRPNFGQIFIHCLLSATTGTIDVGSGYGHKDKCTNDGMSGVLWKGIADGDGVTQIPFKYTPNVANGNIKFAVTCSEGIGHPVYQHVLLIGNYTVPADELITTGPGLAILLLLSIILPIVGVTLYCSWKHFCRKPRTPPSVGKDEDEEEEEEEETIKKTSKKNKYENLKEDE